MRHHSSSPKWMSRRSSRYRSKSRARSKRGKAAQIWINFLQLARILECKRPPRRKIWIISHLTWWRIQLQRFFHLIVLQHLYNLRIKSRNRRNLNTLFNNSYMHQSPKGSIAPHGNNFQPCSSTRSGFCSIMGWLPLVAVVLLCQLWQRPHPCYEHQLELFQSLPLPSSSSTTHITTITSIFKVTVRPASVSWGPATSTNCPHRRHRNFTYIQSQKESEKGSAIPSCAMLHLPNLIHRSRISIKLSWWPKCLLSLFRDKKAISHMSLRIRDSRSTECVTLS